METALQIGAIPVEELIQESWEGVLRLLTSDMDPWDIDIALLARRYRDYLQALREMEFVVPGRMVLTCSVLLRMKSDLLLVAETTGRDELMADLADIEEAADEVPPPVDPGAFALPIVRTPRRQVTLLDLRAALESALVVSRRRAGRLIARVEEDDHDPFEGFEIGGEDVTDRLRALFEQIKGLLSGRRVLSFFRLLARGDREERVHRFFEVLHLAAEGRISCTQKEFLGDILIRLEADA